MVCRCCKSQTVDKKIMHWCIYGLLVKYFLGLNGDHLGFVIWNKYISVINLAPHSAIILRRFFVVVQNIMQLYACKWVNCLLQGFRVEEVNPSMLTNSWTKALEIVCNARSWFGSWFCPCDNKSNSVYFAASHWSPDTMLDAQLPYIMLSQFSLGLLKFFSLGNQDLTPVKCKHWNKKSIYTFYTNLRVEKELAFIPSYTGCRESWTFEMFL